MSTTTPTTRELYDKYVIPTYARVDLRLARGKGTEVWDEDGKRYLDFGAGIAVTSIGHGHPRVIGAMQQQIGTLVHTSNLYYTRPQAVLAERLVRLTCTPAAPRGKVFFCNNTDTPRAGTAYADVIHHEMYNAQLCQKKPAWSGS